MNGIEWDCSVAEGGVTLMLTKIDKNDDLYEKASQRYDSMQHEIKMRKIEVKDLTSDIEQLEAMCEQEDPSDSDQADLGCKLALRGQMKREIKRLEEVKQVNVTVTTVETTNTLVLPAGSLVTLPAFGSVGEGQVRTKLTWVPAIHEVEVEMKVNPVQRQEQQDVDLKPVLEEVVV